MKKLKLCVALSGGIDSSISLFLLKRNKFYIEPVFMNNWKILHDSECNNKIDYIHIQRLCKKLNLNFNFLDFSNEYWNLVFTNFLNSLKKGNTPNPDILCNKKIKFNVLLFYILYKLKLNFLFTGHYAKIEKVKKCNLLKNCFDNYKDQTYFLGKINKSIKKYINFSLSFYSKSKVRITGKLYTIKNYNKKDSVGICFIGKNKFNIFIMKFLKVNPGLIYTDKKILLGLHNGLHFYTIGQSKNILNNNLNNKKYYVYKKNIKKNILYITDNCKRNDIKITKINVTQLKFFYNTSFKILCKAKIRHGIQTIRCLVIKDKKNNKVIFRNSEIFLSIGQYIVFYDKNVCLGGALINKVYL